MSPPSPHPARPGTFSDLRCPRLAAAWAAASILAALPACAPLQREATMPGARFTHTASALEGPFDGVVLDAVTEEPVADATLVALWGFDHGDGLVAPATTVQLRLATDAAGRYRIPKVPKRPRGPSVRLSSFVLLVYKRGYRAYRSDISPGGLPRTDFSARQARIELEKWHEGQSHAEHLLYAAPSGPMAEALAWSLDDANGDLYRVQTGAAAHAPPPAHEDAGHLAPTPATSQEVLDATALLPPEEVIARTGSDSTFEVRDLGDFPPEPFYQGVHLQAAGQDESWDVAYRLWVDPPGGLDPVRETFEATLPGVTPSDEVTTQTWVYDAGDVRAVAFLDPGAKVGLLLTCGASQCADVETAIILAKLAHANLDRVGTRPRPRPTEGAPKAPVPPPGAAPAETGTGDGTSGGGGAPANTKPGDETNAGAKEKTDEADGAAGGPGGAATDAPPAEGGPTAPAPPADGRAGDGGSPGDGAVDPRAPNPAPSRTGGADGGRSP